jgi:L-malate glycosyltransferase
VHVHYAVPNAVSAILARQILAPRPLPVVTTLHGTDVTLVGNDPSYLETTRWAVRESDAVTAVSAWLRDVTEEQLCLEDHPIEVIPNFVDPGRFERASRTAGARRWAQPGERVLVHVSNFRPVKRVMDVLEIFLRVRREMPARLLLVGDGPDRARLESRCRAEGCCDVVTFLGQIQAVEEVLVGADLFLLPSENESFGLAGLEAQACELPVVGARIGGIPEVVIDGETGLLYEVGDVAGMAAGAQSLLAAPERLRAFGRAAREQALARFAEEIVVARYRALYERVLAARAAAGP